MRAVAIGSSAEHGSSIRIDLGLDRDGAGDAQPLLLAARQAERRALEPVLHLVPQRGAAQRLLDDVVELGSSCCMPLISRAEGDVVVDALRERVRLLEHHADAAAHLGRPTRRARRGRCRGSARVPSTRAPGMRSFIRLKQRSTVVLPQPDGPMNAVISCCRTSSVDLAHGAERAVVHRRGRRPRTPSVRASTSGAAAVTTIGRRAVAGVEHRPVGSLIG